MADQTKFRHLLTGLSPHPARCRGGGGAPRGGPTGVCTTNHLHWRSKRSRHLHRKQRLHGDSLRRQCQLYGQ